MKISAITLPTSCMPTAVRFYAQLGFSLHRGGESSTFSTFQVGEHHVNLRYVVDSEFYSSAALVIFAVENVDQTYQQFVEGGLVPEFEPRDAVWGERYFHIRDPDGNALSFAQRLN